MGSDIHIDSQFGSGSRFWFEVLVPLLGPRAVKLPAHGAVVGYEGARRKILIVDDVQSNRSMLTDLLDLAGFSVCEAVNGRDAIDRVQATQPDLILMDMAMPVIDGIEATRRIRALPGWQQVPIITLTANASDACRIECLDAGASGFLSKPIDRAALLSLIGEQLKLHWVVEAVPQESLAP